MANGDSISIGGASFPKGATYTVTGKGKNKRYTVKYKGYTFIFPQQRAKDYAGVGDMGDIVNIGGMRYAKITPPKDSKDHLGVYECWGCHFDLNDGKKDEITMNYNTGKSDNYNSRWIHSNMIEMDSKDKYGQASYYSAD